MARTTKPKTGRTRALVITISDRLGYYGPEFEVRGSVVTARIEDGQAFEIKNVGNLYDYTSHPETSDSKHKIGDNDLDGFEVTGSAKLDEYADDGSKPPQTWGCWAHFNNNLIDGRKAAVILRTITRVEKALADVPDPNYRRDGIGAWFVSVAHAIGAEAILFAEGHGGWYADDAWSALSLGEGLVEIETRYETWVARVAPSHAREEVAAFVALGGH